MVPRERKAYRVSKAYKAMLARQDPQERKVLQDLLAPQGRKEFKVLLVLQGQQGRKEMLVLLVLLGRLQQLLGQRVQQERHQR